MAQIRVHKPLTLLSGRFYVNYYPKANGEMEVVELSLREFNIRLTLSEWEYLVQEVENGRRSK